MSIWGSMKKDWKDIKDSFSGDNSEDPIATIGAKLSVDPLTRALLGDKWKGEWDGMMTRIPNKVNYNASSVIHGDGAPSISSGFDKDTPTDQYAESGHGAGQWIKNKPATTLASLITASMFGAGAMNGAGASGGTSAGTSSGSSAGMGWEDYAQMANSGGQQGQQQPQQTQQEKEEEQRKAIIAELRRQGIYGGA